MPELAAIQEFLRHPRFAVVGVSRNVKDFSRLLFRELREKGFEPVPVNPAAREIDGQRCFARLAEIDPPVQAALLMTPAEQSAALVGECAVAGIGQVWLYRAAGRGAVSEEAVRLAGERGITVISGECPLMFLPGAGLVHRVHGWFKRLTGSYPA
jgi:predicted CoA-binding protein